MVAAGRYSSQGPLSFFTLRKPMPGRPARAGLMNVSLAEVLSVLPIRPFIVDCLVLETLSLPVSVFNAGND